MIRTNGRTGKNTTKNKMAAIAEQGGTTSAGTRLILSPEQMRHTLASLSGGITKPKAKEPEVY